MKKKRERMDKTNRNNNKNAAVAVATNKRKWQHTQAKWMSWRKDSEVVYIGIWKIKRVR